MFYRKTILLFSCIVSCSLVGSTWKNSFSSVWENIKKGVHEFRSPKAQFKRPEGRYTYKEDGHDDVAWYRENTEQCSQRENWYATSKYVGEFWCTVSNIGFFWVAHKHKSVPVLFAGSASALSHAIPKQVLLQIDKFGGAFGVPCYLAWQHRHAIAEAPAKAIVPSLCAISLVFFDAIAARLHGKTWPHVVWHLSAAGLLDYFLTTFKRT